MQRGYPMFRLVSSVKLVRGALNGALLDFSSGRVYALNPLAVQTLVYERQDEELWKYLVGAGLAVEIEEANLPGPSEYTLPRARSETAVSERRLVWFELTPRCNLRCIHCYGEFGQRSEAKALGFVEWQNTMREAYSLGWTRCQLTGGDPFMFHSNGHGPVDLAEYAVDLGYQFVEIYTNGTLMTERDVARIADLKLHVALSLYSVVPEIHDSITGVPGSHGKTLDTLHALLGREVETRVGVIIMRQNQDTASTTEQFLADLGLSSRRPKVIKPVGRGNSELLPDLEVMQKYGLTMKPDFVCNLEAVERATQGNPCLNGHITVTSQGKVLPCVFARDQVVGALDTKGTGLETVLQNPVLAGIWGCTLDHISVCKDCEYRFCCSDCRVSAGGSGKNFLTNPPTTCTYNPYTGEWGQGTWTVVEGSPAYRRFFS